MFVKFGLTMVITAIALWVIDTVPHSAIPVLVSLGLTFLLGRIAELESNDRWRRRNALGRSATQMARRNPH